MKSLETVINESNQVEELRNDYRIADGATGQTKKDLIAKYNVSTKKAKDIQNAILIKLQEIRKNKKTFDEKDVTEFSRLSGDSETKYFEELKKENDEFVKYLLDIWEARLKKSKDLFRYVNMTSFSGYSFSSAEKWQIKRYQKIREELASRDPKNIANKKKEEYSIDALTTKLGTELEDFKKEYLKRVEKSADQTYDKLPEEIEFMTKKLKEMEDEFEEKRKEIKGYMARYYAQEPIRKYSSKLAQKKAIIIRYKTKKEFIDECLNDAEKTFRGNVDALAHRLYDKKFNVEKIKISNVKDDPKIFKLLIEDDTKKLYCRSILAAEFSSKMVPHFRFIMTDHK